VRAAPEDEAVVAGEAEAARVARAARKQSERRTYLVAAVMSSLGITSMAAAAVYYRFAWQMEVRYARADPCPSIHSIRPVDSHSWMDAMLCCAWSGRRRDPGDGDGRHLRALGGRRGEFPDSSSPTAGRAVWAVGSMARRPARTDIRAKPEKKSSS
jgi:hypothetical protein